MIILPIVLLLASVVAGYLAYETHECELWLPFNLIGAFLVFGASETGGSWLLQLFFRVLGITHPFGWRAEMQLQPIALADAAFYFGAAVGWYAVATGIRAAFRHYRHGAAPASTEG